MQADRVPNMLQLAELPRSIPALTPALGGTLAEAAAICLANQGHSENCILYVRWDTEQRVFTLQRQPVSEPMHRAYRDLQEATELGACGIAILVVRDITGYTTVERSVKGTGFDYWLGNIDSSDNSLEPLERRARLEVSGILQGAMESVEARVREKIRQARRSAGEYTAYVVVVKFDTPIVWMVQDE